MSYASVSGHRSMALDATRNRLYREALQQVVRPDSVVLDLGAGTGIHGLIAARLGAKRVYLVEPEDILAVAEEIVAANGLQEKVRCLRGRLEDIQLPEPVDIIVSAVTGNFLLTEDLLPTLFHARGTALKPGGLLIPGAATMAATPVSAATIHAKEIAAWSAPAEGIDLSAARGYAANSVFYRLEDLGDVQYLAEPQVLQTFDFSRDNDASVHSNTAYEITESAVCHGWVGWFSMKLGDRWVSTSPRDEPLHWSPAFLPLDPPVAFERGERVSFTLDRAAFGDWSWRIRSATIDQRHSTLLSAPMDAATLKKAVIDYAPSLNVDGRALAEVLAQCDGSVGAQAIAQSLCDRYPGRYHSAAEALAFVQRVIKRYA
jgi:SAM-dependent methyltransferase